MKVKEIADVLCYGGPVYLKSANGSKIQSFKTNIVAKEDHVSIFLK